jgi:hypothetical protein
MYVRDTKHTQINKYNTCTYAPEVYSGRFAPLNDRRNSGLAGREGKGKGSRVGKVQTHAQGPAVDTDRLFSPPPPATRPGCDGDGRVRVQCDWREVIAVLH